MTMSVEFWLEFFESAGFDRDQAVSYANIFCVNRIQLEHLPSFDREMLREMNITAMGDIVTILTYIKKICGGVVCTSKSLPVTETPIYYQSAHLPNTENYGGKDNFVSSTQHLNIINPKTPPSQNPVVQRISPLMHGSQQSPSEILPTHTVSSSRLPETTDRLLQRTPASTFLTAPVIPHAASSSSTEDKFLEQCNPQHVVRQNSEANERYSSSPPYEGENYERSEEQVHGDSVTPAEVVTNGDVTDSEESYDCYTFDNEDRDWQKPTPDTLPDNINSVNTSKGTVHFKPTAMSLNCKIEDVDLTSEAASDEGLNLDYSEDLSTTEGFEAPQQRRSVFERLGKRPVMNQISPKWHKPVFSRLGNGKTRGKKWKKKGNAIHRNIHRPNGFINRNPTIQNHLERIPLYGQKNRYFTVKGASSVKGHAPVENNYSAIPTEICNGDENPEFGAEDEVLNNCSENIEPVSCTSTRSTDPNPSKEGVTSRNSYIKNHMGRIPPYGENSRISAEKVAPSSKVHAPVENNYSDNPAEICNGDADPQFSDEDEVQSNCSENSEAVTCASTGITSPNTAEEDRNYLYSEEDSQESCSSKVEDNETSTLQRVVPHVNMKERKSQAGDGIAKLSHQEMRPEGSELDGTSYRPKSSYSSPHQAEVDLEKLKDSTCTKHSENYFLAWVHRRKNAHSFTGARPNFL